MTVIALTGYARSGKDSVGACLVEDHGFRRVAFGDVLKDIARDMDPLLRLGDEQGMTFYAELHQILDTYDGSWEKVKDAHPEARQYLVDLGNALRKRIPKVETAWWLEDAVLAGENVVNTNVYHREELEEIQRHGGIIVRIIRPGIGPANPDEAETGKVIPDTILVNDGTLEDLRNHVADFVRAVIA